MTHRIGPKEIAAVADALGQLAAASAFGDEFIGADEHEIGDLGIILDEMFYRMRGPAMREGMRLLRKMRELEQEEARAP